MPKRYNPQPRRLTSSRYVDQQGNRCDKDAPGAEKIKVTGETYYVQVRKLEGKGHTWVSLKTTDLGRAWVELDRVLKEREQQRLGLEADPYTRQAVRPIAEHLEEWLDAVAASGVTGKRVGMMRSRMALLVQLAGWKRIGEIRKSTCLAALAKLQTMPHPRSKDGRSAQTRNHFLSHARQFARWLHDEHRLRENPLSGLKPVSVEGDRRHDRRCPSDEEVQTLFDVLDGFYPDYLPPMRGTRGQEMSGPQRALAYQTAMCTGFRAGEIRSLTPAHFDFVLGEVRLRGGADKRRRRVVQPIPGWLAAKVKAWLDGGGGLWEGFPAAWPGRLLQADLELARDAWIDAAKESEERLRRKASATLCYEVQGLDGPLYWDFHSFRSWYISQLAGQNNITPAVLQTLCRHSEPRLTLLVYAKARREGIQEAMGQIKEPGSGKGEGTP